MEMGDSVCPFCESPIPPETVENHRTFLARETRREGRSRGLRQIVYGLLVAVAGIVITVVTYGIASSSRGGGRYFIAYGAVIVGGMYVIRGLAGFVINLFGS
jgi:hypothetical protein